MTKEEAWGELRSALEMRDLIRIDTIIAAWEWEDWCDALMYARRKGYKPPRVRGETLSEDTPKKTPNPLQLHWVSELNSNAHNQRVHRVTNNGRIMCVMPEDYYNYSYSPANVYDAESMWFKIMNDTVWIDGLGASSFDYSRGPAQGFWGIRLPTIPEPGDFQHPAHIDFAENPFPTDHRVVIRPWSDDD